MCAKCKQRVESLEMAMIDLTKFKKEVSSCAATFLASRRMVKRIKNTSSSFSTHVPDVMIATFTPLHLRLTTWSTINDINGENTGAKQGAFVLSLKSNTNGRAS